MHNLVWKHLKLIPLIQLGGLGERCKVPKRFSILVDMNDCYKMIVKLTSLYKLRNIKCSGFEIE